MAKYQEAHATPSSFLEFLRRFRRNTSAIVGGGLVLIVVLVAVFASQIAPYDPYEQDIYAAFQVPSRKHLMGTDEFGRDEFSRVAFGARTSLTVGLLVVVVGAGAGTVLGVVSGHFGGRVDAVIGRLFDVLMAFPGILLAMVVLTILGPSLFNALLALAISSIPSFGRVARGQVLSAKENEYVMAALASGCDAWRIMFVHILPNIIAPILVMASLRVAGTILQASTLSFLGLGAQPPTAEWGAMLSTGRDYMRYAPWLTTYPGLAIMVTVLGINLLGDGFRDILDPRLRGQTG